MKSNISPFEVSAENPDWQQPLVFGKGMLPWQQDAFKGVRGARFSFIVAFMGSGKSYVQLTLGADEIIKSKARQKQLVIVPQSHIHAGFIDETLHIGAKVVKWEVLPEHIFLSEFGARVMDRLKEWLLTPGEELFGEHGASYKHVKGTTAVTSHSALGKLWQSLTPRERAKAVKYLTLRVDEAHHINNILDTHEEGMSKKEMKDAEAEANNLSAVCSYILKSADETAHLSLTTATPFRGDQDDILKKSARGKFKTYHLPFFDHWRSLGIKSFNLEYLLYKKDPVQMCYDRIVAEPNERHMVVVPMSGHKWREKKGTSQKSLNRLLRILNKAFPGQVLDLVTEETQKENISKLRDEPRQPGEKESKIHVVVTCMLGREGTDWCPCSRLHNLSCEASITLAVQTLGRPFRRFAPIKQGVRCFNYVAEFEPVDENSSVKEILSHRTNALLTCMIFDEGFHPILLPKVPGQSGRKGETLQAAVERRGVDYHEFKAALIEELEGSEDYNLERRTSGSVLESIENVLDDFGIKQDRERIAQGANLVYARGWLSTHKRQATEMQANGIDVRFLLACGYDKLVETISPVDRSIVFTGEFAERDLRELRKVFEGNFYEKLAQVAAVLKGAA